MYKGKKVTVIIGAAGSGSRMGGPLPKQFMKMGGRTILEMAVQPFEQAPEVDRILVVTNQDFVMYCRALCSVFTKVVHVTCGGLTRQESIGKGLDWIVDWDFCSHGDGDTPMEIPGERAGKRGEGAALKEQLILIHDGARPFVNRAVIQSVLEETEKIGAAVPVVACKDTVRHVTTREGAAAISSRTLDRSALYQVQTPQGFRGDRIVEGMEAARRDGFTGTDDASLVERLGYPVALAEGSYENRKITTREDLPVEVRVGTGFDVHALTEGRKLILGGVEIPYEKGLMGHSDADVMVHALMDAMLGAAGLGDIGRHFPDSDEKYRDISSLKLLEEVVRLIGEAGYILGNGDITIIAQKPKLTAYIPEMEKNLQAVLQAEPGTINVKATTTEKLGFTGRGEGIAAEAVCILNK